MCGEFPIDPDTIRSREQLEATRAAATHGCAWCLPEEEQKSSELHQVDGLVVVRVNAFPKEFRRMFLIHPIRHVSKSDMNVDEVVAMHKAELWLLEQLKIEDAEAGGGIVHRWGNRKRNASSLPDDHYFVSVVLPDGTGPVKETLCKSQTPEDQARRKERAEGFK